MKIMGKDRTLRQLMFSLFFYTKFYIRTVISGIASIVPQFIFGNSVGFKNNIFPRIELYRFRNAYTTSLPGGDSIEFARELKTNGVCIFQQQNNMASLELIKKKLELIFNDPAHYLDSPNKTQKRIIDPLEMLPELKTIFLDIISNTIIAYYGCAFKIVSVQVWRNLGVDCREREKDRRDYMSNTLHNDYMPVTSLRVFIILSDNVTKKTGAFRYHEKKRTKSIMRSFNYFHRFLLFPKSFNKLYNPDNLNYFEGLLGDSCLVNTQDILHASSVPEEGSIRDVVQYLIMPEPGPAVSGRDLFENIPVDKEMLKFLEEAGRTLSSPVC